MLVHMHVEAEEATFVKKLDNEQAGGWDSIYLPVALSYAQCSCEPVISEDQQGRDAADSC